jgi:hypothetical protein
LAFQLTDGSLVGDGNNTVVIGNSQFDGGGVSGTAMILGDVADDLTSSVMLIDNTLLNYLIQQFTPGNALSLTGFGHDGYRWCWSRRRFLVLDPGQFRSAAPNPMVGSSRISSMSLLA